MDTGCHFAAGCVILVNAMIHAKLTHLALPLSLAGLLLVAGCNKNQPPQNEPASSVAHDSCTRHRCIRAECHAGCTCRHSAAATAAATARHLYHPGGITYNRPPRSVHQLEDGEGRRCV